MDGWFRGAHRVRAGAFVVVLALLSAPGWTADPPPLVAPAMLDRTEHAALDLARKGRRVEADIVLDVDAELGAPPAQVAAAREAVVKALTKAKPAPLPIPDAAKAVAKLATDLAAALPSLGDEPRTRVARQVLRLDGANRAANDALGRVERGAAWIPAWMSPLLARRAEIQSAVQTARHLPLEVEVEESWMPILETLHGVKGSAVRCGEVSVHSATHSVEQLTRQLKQGLRASALTDWLIGGEMTPARGSKCVIVLVAKMDGYKRAIAAARKAGEIDEAQFVRAQQLGAFYAAGYSVVHATGETDIGANVFFETYARVVFEAKSMNDAQAALRAGQMNWVYTNFLGIPMPSIAWDEKPQERKGVTSDTPQAAAERDEMMRLAKAGLAGSRLFMKWLVRRGEDPAWAKSFVDEVGKIQGADLMKCMLVVDYLQESKDLANLLHETWGEKPCAETFEKGLGMTLPAFEERWREWLLAGDPPSGLAQMLGTAPMEPVAAADRPVLDSLNSVRRRTLGKDAAAVGIDRDLSDGCRAHALYLGKHPKQLTAWPDAHEEFPDQEGFSAAGCRAGLSSVIVGPGIGAPADAIDGWMATFYHRLPLIDPGLVRIGWGLENGIAVLDSGSLVGPSEKVCFVPWPPANSKDMPRRFPGELPNPVPGEDQSQWGYPVTLQFFEFAEEADVQMRLYAGGKRGGAQVPCWYSTPKKPTNTELAPAGAFCLIPKTPLAANTLYTVAVDGWPKDAGGTDWTFTTGAK